MATQALFCRPSNTTAPKLLAFNTPFSCVMLDSGEAGVVTTELLEIAMAGATVSLAVCDSGKPSANQVKYQGAALQCLKADNTTGLVYTQLFTFSSVTASSTPTPGPTVDGVTPGIFIAACIVLCFAAGWLCGVSR